MPNKIIPAIILILLTANAALAWNMSGNIDLSYQYNSNFLDTGLVEEASALVTGEAVYSKEVKLNLGVEHNFSANNYTKFEYSLAAKDYNMAADLNNADNTFSLQIDQHLNEDTAFKTKISATDHNEGEPFKKYSQWTLMLGGTRNLTKDLNFELGFTYDDKNTEYLDPRDYFAYMSYYQNTFDGRLRYQFARDLIVKLSARNSDKIYDHRPSAFLSGVFPHLAEEFRKDQATAYEFELTKVINENLLADFSAGYTYNFSNIAYYSYVGNILGASVFGYWLGNRWDIKYSYGDYLYPRRSWGGYREEKIRGESASIGIQREIAPDVFVSLKWEGLRNTSSNPVDEFSNDCYTGGVSIRL